MVFDFDTLVLGGGQGGSLARMLAEGGQKVALVEKSAWGGTCTNHGCTPSKAQIASAKRAFDACNSHKLGVEIEGIDPLRSEIVARSQAIVHSFRDGIEERLEKVENLQLFRGTGRFTGTNTLEVMLCDGQIQTITAKDIVIAVGAKAKTADIDGLESIDWLDHARALNLHETPEHLVVLGGGYIACELAQMFNRCGSRVTLVQKGDRLLTHEDECVSQAIAQILRDEKIEVIFNSKIDNVSKNGDDISVQVSGLEGGSSREINASHLLVAIGHKPNTEEINAESLGIQLGDKGEIITDEFLEAAPNVFALGDCKGGPAFTHVAFDDARILSGFLLRGEKRSIKNRLVPYVVYTDPQLGRVGLSENEAKEKGLNYEVEVLPICDTARGIESGEETGFLQAIVEKETGEILGGAFLARDGGELISLLQTAMMGHLKAHDLRDAVFAHPTQSEALNRLFGLFKSDFKSP
jgi:pyruvate/2-oxoglutarate dehydrogenase complex dihydrolipoamide dehydrogenase (E3) component